MANKIRANRRMFDYLGLVSSPSYLRFLQKHLLDGSPNFYCVLSKKKVDTQDGTMYAVRLGLDINDPSYEPIAECWINGQLLYLWRDYCWAIAINDAGEALAYEVCDGKAATKLDDSLKYRTNRIEKMLILHHISNDKLSTVSVTEEDDE